MGKKLVKENRCKNNLFGRHASNGPNVEWNFAKKEDIDFTWKKVAITPVKAIEFLGLVANSVDITLALPQEKALYVQNKWMQLIASPSPR